YVLAGHVAQDAQLVLRDLPVAPARLRLPDEGTVLRLVPVADAIPVGPVPAGVIAEAHRMSLQGRVAAIPPSRTAAVCRGICTATVRRDRLSRQPAGHATPGAMRNGGKP